MYGFYVNSACWQYLKPDLPEKQLFYATAALTGASCIGPNDQTFQK